jgi:hypothetical protein
MAQPQSPVSLFSYYIDPHVLPQLSMWSGRWLRLHPAYAKSRSVVLAPELSRIVNKLETRFDIAVAN